MTWWRRLFDTQQKGLKGSAHKASCLQPRHPPHHLAPTEPPRTLHANRPCIHFLQKIASERRRNSSHIPLLPGRSPALPPPHIPRHGRNTRPLDPYSCFYSGASSQCKRLPASPRLGEPWAGSRWEVLRGTGIVHEMEASGVTPRQTALNFRQPSVSREDAVFIIDVGHTQPGHGPGSQSPPVSKISGPPATPHPSSS